MKLLAISKNEPSLHTVVATLSGLESCVVKGAPDAESALEILRKEKISALFVCDTLEILSDVGHHRGVEATPIYNTMPIIFIMQDPSPATRLAAAEIGATEILEGPIDATEVRFRLRNLLRLARAQRDLSETAAGFMRRYADAMEALERREEEIIRRLSKAIEIRDGDTGQHVDRVSELSNILALQLGLTHAEARMISMASPLHDVGKLGVPDRILLKTGPLSPDERQEMQLHAVLGQEILKGSSSRLINIAEGIAAGHHEWWDGTGYPFQLKGEQIPLAARIVAVADVFDALCSKRSYKSAWSPSRARSEIVKSSGTQFDPRCVVSGQAIPRSIETRNRSFSA